MELDADCLRWAKIENLERLLRALGTPLPLRSYDANLYRMRLVRMAEHALKNDRQRDLEEGG